MGPKCAASGAFGPFRVRATDLAVGQIDAGASRFRRVGRPVGGTCAAFSGGTNPQIASASPPTPASTVATVSEPSASPGIDVQMRMKVHADETGWYADLRRSWGLLPILVAPLVGGLVLALRGRRQ